jgi:transcriptional regulator with XRE-family HTH domain
MAGHIRAVLEGAGLTQTVVAEALGIQQSAISKRYRDKSAWPASDLRVLAERFGIPITDFYPASSPAEAS